jgi:hypothetical protein
MIVLSDLHIGGLECLLHSTARDTKGNHIRQTVQQEMMWNNLITRLKEEPQPDILNFLGDLVEGRNPKVGGLDIINTDTDVMTTWATEALSEIIDILKPKMVLSVQGSAYHQQDGGSDLDYRITKNLSLIHRDIPFIYDQKLYVKLGEKIHLYNHYIGGDWKNPPFPFLTRVYTDLLNGAFDTGLFEKMPTVIGYGHLHMSQTPVVIKPSDVNPGYGFVGACQKIGDSHLSRGPFLRHPHIGYLSIIQDGVDMSGKFIRTYKPYLDETDLRNKITIF